MNETKSTTWSAKQIAEHRAKERKRNAEILRIRKSKKAASAFITTCTTFVILIRLGFGFCWLVAGLPFFVFPFVALIGDKPPGVSNAEFIALIGTFAVLSIPYAMLMELTVLGFDFMRLHIEKLYGVTR